MPGRPKKKRTRDPDERDPKNPNRLRRTGLVMTCQRCLQSGHNARTCQREPVPKPHKESGKRGRPRKNPALVAATTRRGTSKAPSSQTASAALKKVIAKERAQARNGIGLLVCEGIGNTYLHMSSGAGIHTTPGSSNNQSTSTSSRAAIPTQESHIQ